MGRASCCSGDGIKRGSWTAEEDHKLKAYIESHGEGGWRSLPARAGLERCGKSCRLRWANYLKPGIKRGCFTPQEDQTIIKLHQQLGNRWAAIARELPMRTDNEIKNYWNAHLKKRVANDEVGQATDEDLEIVLPPAKRPAVSSAQLLNRLATRVALVQTCLARNHVPLQCHSTTTSSQEEEEEEEGYRSSSLTTATWWCDDANGNDEGSVSQSSKSEKDEGADLKHLHEDVDSGNFNFKSEAIYDSSKGRRNCDVAEFPEFRDSEIDDFLFGMGSSLSDFTFLDDLSIPSPTP